MSVIVAGLSSIILAQWASKKRANIKQAQIDHFCSIPVVTIAGLNSLLPRDDGNDNHKKLIFLRGVVLPTSFTTLGPAQVFSSAHESPAHDTDTVRSNSTDMEALVVEETRTTLVYDKVSVGWAMKFKLGAPLGADPKKKIICKKRKQVPFLIADYVTKPCTEYVMVTLDCLDQQVPLQKVCSVKKLISNQGEKASFFWNRKKQGLVVKVDELIEEEILPLGSVITAVGLFSSENGIRTIKPCPDLGYFLTSKTKEELVSELSTEVARLTEISENLLKVSVGLAGYAIITFVLRFIRNLNR